VFSVTQFVLRHSPPEAFRVDVVDEMFAKFQEKVERRSCLKKFVVRICDLILGPPSDRVRLADRLEEAIGRHWVEQAVRQEADAKLEAL
jgi:hypothetical protein